MADCVTKVIESISCSWFFSDKIYKLKNFSSISVNVETCRPLMLKYASSIVVSQCRRGGAVFLIEFCEYCTLDCFSQPNSAPFNGRESTPSETQSACEVTAIHTADHQVVTGKVLSSNEVRCCRQSSGKQSVKVCQIVRAKYSRLKRRVAADCRSRKVQSTDDPLFHCTESATASGTCHIMHKARMLRSFVVHGWW